MYVRISQAGIDAVHSNLMIPKNRVHRALYFGLGAHPIDRKELVTAAAKIIEINGGISTLGREFSHCRSVQAAARYLVRWLVGERGIDTIDSPYWEILPE